MLRNWWVPYGLAAAGVLVNPLHGGINTVAGLVLLWSAVVLWPGKE